MEAAMGFCAENLPPSSHFEAFTRCSSALEAHIVDRIDPAGNISSGHRQQAQSQQNTTGEDAADAEAWLTVPLNIDGIETALEIRKGAVVEDLADEICRRDEFGLTESSLESCSSQVQGYLRLRLVDVFSDLSFSISIVYRSQQKGRNHTAASLRLSAVLMIFSRCYGGHQSR